MQTRISRAKIAVYVIIAVLALAVLTVAVVHLPGLMQHLHGAG